MKTRIRFLITRIEMSIDDIASAVNDIPYRESTGIGIASSCLNNDHFAATFIEKKRVYEQIDYPSGETEKIERIKYLYINFEIIHFNESIYIIQIENPPASLKSFLNHMGKIFKSLSVEKYQFDLNKFYMTIKNNKQVSSKVSSLKASSIPFSEKSTAKLEIISDNDAYRELKRVYGEKKYKLDRLVFLLFSHEVESVLTITSTGSAIFDREKHNDTILHAFTQSIIF